jgi:predicted N-acetyltransferase YhbS
MTSPADSDPRPGPAVEWTARAVRFGRSSRRYDDTIAFYRDLVGLPVIDRFADSFGEDGTILGLPGSGVQLEVVRAHAGEGPSAPRLDQLVLYFDGPEAMSSATAELRASGLEPVQRQHPYWSANGARTYEDPDGREVVFAPWVFGREPDPIDREVRTEAPRMPYVNLYLGDREELRPLFEEAEDSQAALDGYLHQGRVLVVREGLEVVGHLQLVPTEQPDVVELKSMAVTAARRGSGLGRLLVTEALRMATAEGRTRMVVATAAADVGNLRFYQRCGFRLTAIESDAFTVATGYDEGTMIDGIPLRDRVWLAQELADPSRQRR